MVARSKLHLVSRVLVGLAMLLVGLVAVEALTSGMVMAGFADSLEDYLPLLSGIGLVALFAAGVKYAFRLRTRYWILFLVLLVVFSLIVVAVQMGVFLG